MVGFIRGERSAPTVSQSAPLWFFGRVKPWQTFVFVVLVTAVTLWGRLAMGTPLGGCLTVVMFILPIILSAYVGGFWAGLLATILCYVGTTYSVLPPLHGLAFGLKLDRWQEAFLVLAGVAISVLNEALHRSRDRTDSAVREHQQADERIRWLASIPEQNPNPIAEFEQESGALAYANPAARELFLDLELLGLGHPWLAGVRDLAGSWSAQPSEIVKCEALLGKRYYILTVMCLPASGRVRLYGNDISERKVGEAALSESEDLFSKAFRLSPDCVTIVRVADGALIKANEALCLLWATTPDEVVGKTTEDYSRWLSEDEHRAFLQALEKNEECLNYEASLRMNDGRVVQFSISSRKITLTGEPCILSVRRDVTNERQTEKALNASELRYRRLFESAKDGILILDAETGMVVDVNPFLIKILGFSHEQFLGKAIWELGFFKDIWANAEMFAELKEKEYVRYEHLPLETSGGKRIEVEFVSNVYLVNGSKVIQCNVRDVTARREAEETVRELNANLEQRVIERTTQLEAANKELEAFSYSVSHDLRAPVRAMDGYSQAILEDYGAQLPEEGRRYLQTIREGAQKMGMLIDDLLTFSRLSRAPLKKQDVNANELIASVLDDLRSLLKGRQVELRIGELPRCLADPALLRQVWVNLLSNALKYTQKREAAVVEIGCEAKPEGNVYFVRDNGTGFDMRYANKLFGVFQRLHREEDYEGTGVGLAIVQRIVHRHGGRIWAEAAVNRGATFYFTLDGKTKL